VQRKLALTISGHPGFTKSVIGVAKALLLVSTMTPSSSDDLAT
jgi:hypothetical protein